MTPWRFLDSGPGPGTHHMAIDEALLEAVAAGRSPPVLRLFAFQPPCLSLGRFQACLGRMSADLSAPVGKATHRHLDPAALDGIDVVRRPTGGRAVLHGGDLCYAVVAPIDDPAVGGSIRHSYSRLAAALAQALEMLGAPSDVGATFRSPAELRLPTPGDLKVAPTPPLTGISLGSPSRHPAACFAALGPSELTVAGTKVIGSAQLRRDAAFLQQGSLRLQADPEGEARLLGHCQPALADLLGRPIHYQEAAAALRHAFAQALAITFQPSSLTREEQAIAETLEREKYANAAWTWQR